MSAKPFDFDAWEKEQLATMQALFKLEDGHSTISITNSMISGDPTDEVTQNQITFFLHEVPKIQLRIEQVLSGIVSSGTTVESVWLHLTPRSREVLLREALSRTSNSDRHNRESRKFSPDVTIPKLLGDDEGGFLTLLKHATSPDEDGAQSVKSTLFDEWSESFMSGLKPELHERHAFFIKHVRSGRQRFIYTFIDEMLLLLQRFATMKSCSGCSTFEGDLKHGQVLLQCGKCKDVYYCSRTCQVKDWKNGHKQSCGKPPAETREVREVTSDLMKQMNDLREEPDRQYFLYGPGKKRLNIVFGLRGEGFADSFIKDRDLAFKTGDWKAVLDFYLVLRIFVEHGDAGLQDFGLERLAQQMEREFPGSWDFSWDYVPEDR